MATPTNLELNPLIPFSMIIDTDFGLIRMINKKYHNTDTFYSSLLSMPNENLIELLYTRKDLNPLSIIMKDKNKEIMDSYYDQFMKLEYDDIMNLSHVTSIYTLIKLSLNTEGIIKPCILCESKKEEEFLLAFDKETFSKCNIIINSLSLLNLREYDPIYVKYYKDAIDSYKTLIGRNMYIAGYRFNFVKDKENEFSLNPALKAVLGNANKIKIAEIYNIEKIYQEASK